MARPRPPANRLHPRPPGRRRDPPAHTATGPSAGSPIRGLRRTSAAALTDNPAIRGSVDTAVHTASGTLSRSEQIKRHAIVPAFWAPDGDELTPTMKPRRQPIAAKYADTIESLYDRTTEPECRKVRADIGTQAP